TLYFVLSELESQPVALLSSLLFAVYPPNVETVAWVSEIKSTLAFLFFLWSFHFYIRGRNREGWINGLVSAAFLMLSLLSKINTVVAPLIFLLYDYRKNAVPKGRQAAELAGLFLIAVVFASIHLASSTTLSQGAPEFLADATLKDPSLRQPHAL